MVRDLVSDIDVSGLEKTVINFALPLDVVYHTFKSGLVKNQYSNQTIPERIKSIYEGKILKYQRLLDIKKRHTVIPERIKSVCRKTPCGTVRLGLTYLR